MILPDVNVLVYAYRADMADHHRYRDDHTRGAVCRWYQELTVGLD